MPTEKQEVTLYNGEVEITFYPTSHRYKLKGRKDYLIGTTTATGMLDKSRVLIPWAVGLAQEYMLQAIYGRESLPNHELHDIIHEACRQHTVKKEEAAGAGTIVHEWAEKFTVSVLNGEDAPGIDHEWPEEVLNGINAFLEWYTTHDVKFEASERIVFSRKHEYVGTCDAIAQVDGKRYMIDYKTSKGIYNEMYAQVSAYYHAYMEETGDELDGALIIKFGKEDGGFETKNITKKEIDIHQNAFIAMLTLKKWDKQQTKVWRLRNSK